MAYRMQNSQCRLPLAILVAGAVVLAGVACSRPVVKQYEKDGVRFSYYSNWLIAKDAPIDGHPDMRSIQLQGPSHAVISLICEPSSSPQTLEQFADGVAARRGAAIERKLSLGDIKTAQVTRGSSHPATGKIAGRARQGIMQQFSVELLGQQMPHHSWFYLVEGARCKMMIMYQIADTNAAEMQEGSNLILQTLAIEGEA